MQTNNKLNFNQKQLINSFFAVIIVYTNIQNVHVSIHSTNNHLK